MPDHRPAELGSARGLAATEGWEGSGKGSVSALASTHAGLPGTFHQGGTAAARGEGKVGKAMGRTGMNALRYSIGILQEGREHPGTSARWDEPETFDLSHKGNFLMN